MKGKLKLVENGDKNGLGKKAAPQNGFKNGVDEKKKIGESVSALAKQDICGLIDSATYSPMAEVRKKALEMLSGDRHALKFISVYSPWKDTREEAEGLLLPVTEGPEKP